MPNITPITDGSLTACIPLNLSGAASYCQQSKQRNVFILDFSSHKMDILLDMYTRYRLQRAPGRSYHISMHQNC